MLSYFHGTLVRGAMQNLDTGDFINFMLNPTQLQTNVAVNYAQKNTIGGSHQWLQYTHTSNVTFSVTLKFVFSVYVDTFRGMTTIKKSDFPALFDGFEDNRRFLMELCYPRGQANDPLRRSPPLCLLLWPKHVAIMCVVRSLQFQDSRFNQDQRVIEFTANLSLEEYRQHRFTSKDARKKGLLRARSK